jgi:hypothetical protein
MGQSSRLLGEFEGLFKINLPETTAAQANSAESLHMRDQDEVNFEASTDLLLRINSLVLAALSSRQNYSANPNPTPHQDLYGLRLRNHANPL